MVISLYNIKGGVGKTSTAVNLAYLASKKEKTLLWDLDPQGAATYLLGKKVKKKFKIDIKRIDKNLFLIPASFGLFNKILIKEYLKKLNFNYIFLDTPASINNLTLDILKYSDLILVPVLPNILSLRTYNQILDLTENKNIKLFINGLENKTSHKKIIKNILTLPKEQYLKTYIPKSNLIENMPFLSIVTKEYPHSKITKAYEKFLEEIFT